jgi:hypothetical protein
MGPAEEGDSSSRRLQGRFGHWQSGLGGGRNDIGLGMDFRSGNTRTTLEVGYTLDFECATCGTLMAGVDINMPITDAAPSGPGGVRVALNPALGIGVPRGGGGVAFAAALNAPVSIAIATGKEALLIPFLSPGLGYGLISGSTDVSGGARAMMSGGVSIAGGSSSPRVTLSFRTIFLDGAPTVYGIGFSLPQ